MSLEIELRRRHGEKPKPSDYYARFPGEEANILAAWVPDARTSPQGVVTSETEPYKREFSPAAHSVVLPAHFGSYELLTEIGRGGMGVVFLARQAGLNKMVALKTILAGELAMPEDVQRF